MSKIVKDKSRDFWIKVPKQKDGRKVNIIVLIPTIKDKRFTRHVMNFYVLDAVTNKLRTDFKPELELKVGLKSGEGKLALHYWDDKARSGRGKLIKFKGHANTTYHKKKKNSKLYKWKGHTLVKLAKWGDPNVGWG